MKLIGVIHKSTPPERVAKLKNAGLSEARIHLSKMKPEEAERLIQTAAAQNLDVCLDTRGNKPTIVTITLPNVQKPVDKVLVQRGDAFLFQSQPVADVDATNYKAVFTLSYLPQLLAEALNQELCIDDGNILLRINKLHFDQDKVVGLDTTVTFIDLDKVDAIYHEGVSSFDIPLHSHAQDLLTDYDKQCLSAIREDLRPHVARIGISFAETPEQILQADKYIKSAGYINTRVVAKIETLIGVDQVVAIADALIGLYGKGSELWIARGDLAIALHGKADLSLESVERQIFDALQDKDVQIIVATDVATSLRNFRFDGTTAATLSASERDNLKNELALGADGFVLAGEMYAGPQHQGEYAEQVLEAVVDAIKTQS